jgi:hypothetical protein
MPLCWEPQSMAQALRPQGSVAWQEERIGPQAPAASGQAEKRAQSVAHSREVMSQAKVQVWTEAP